MIRTIYIGPHGLVAPHVRITAKRPLVGILGGFGIAWLFDGKKLLIRRAWVAKARAAA